MFTGLDYAVFERMKMFCGEHVKITSVWVNKEMGFIAICVLGVWTVVVVIAGHWGFG